MLRIALLGSFHVERDGVIVPETAWQRRKARSLLKLLALRPGHQIHKDQAIELLWPDQNAGAARDNLYRTLYHLRHALEPELARAADSRFVAMSEELLRLGPADVWVDVKAFEDLVEQARSATNPIPLLEHAITLYAGDLLEADPYEEWALARREALRNAYAEALVTLAANYREHGSIDTAIAALRRVLDRDPADERAHRELMLSLARAGRRHDALRQYQICADALGRELGVEPTAQTTALFEQIRDDDLAAPANAATPIALEPPGATVDNLPEPTTSFVGREDELRSASALLARADVRLLTLTGPGGTGKTRLALQVAAGLRGSFHNGICFVTLAPIRESALVLPAIAQALGLGRHLSADGPEPLQALKALLRERTLLLVLDNFEHVLAAAPDVAELLAAAPRLKLLVTSRAALHISGEHELSVPPLPLPASTAGMEPEQAAAALRESPAVALFVQRTQAISPHFRPNIDDLAAIAAICARLDGLPLAIELAATRGRLFAPQALLERLREGESGASLALLTGGARDLPERQQTIRSTIAWSYNLLDEAEQALFRRVSVFVGGFTIAAAAAIVGQGQASALLDRLSSLVDKSLLRPIAGADGEPRFGMLETIREGALEQLEASGEADETRRRHATYFLELANPARPRLGSGARTLWLARLEAEHANLRAALAWHRRTAKSGPPDFELCGALGWVWFMRASLGERLGWFEDVLVGAAERTALRASALHSAGMLALYHGDRSTALQRLEESLALWRELGSRRIVARALADLGTVLTVLGDYDGAIAHLKESLRLLQDSGTAWETASVLSSLGNTIRAQGDLARAQRLLEESLVLFQESGDEQSSTLPIFDLGKLALRQGDYVQARARLSEALTLWRERGEERLVALTLSALGHLEQAEGNHSQANSHISDALAIFQSLQDRRNMAHAHNGLGENARAEGDLSAAAASYEEGLRLARAEGDEWMAATILHNLGYVAQARANQLLAARLFADSLRLSRALGHETHIVLALAGIAGTLIGRDTGRAARLFGAAEALGATFKLDIEPVDKRAQERNIARLRERLAPQLFAEEWARGRMMTIEQAIAETQVFNETSRYHPSDEFERAARAGPPVGVP